MARLARVEVFAADSGSGKNDDHREPLATMQLGKADDANCNEHVNVDYGCAPDRQSSLRLG